MNEQSWLLRSPSARCFEEKSQCQNEAAASLPGETSEEEDASIQ